MYAENPAEEFHALAGPYQRTWRMPEEGAGLDNDAGYRKRRNVSPHYDAMLAKVIA